MRRRDFILGLAGALSPAVVRAEQSSTPKRIVLLSASVPVEQIRTHPYWSAFLDQLSRLGFAEGQNLVVDVYSGNGEQSTYGSLARAIVASAPDAIFTVGPLSSECKAATATIPIVALASDPVGIGLAPSLSRPGANLTGVTTDGGLEIDGKRLEILIEARPKATRVGYLTSSRNLRGAHGAAVRDSAQRLKVSTIAFDLGDFINEAAYSAAFLAIGKSGIDALLVAEQAEHITNGKSLVNLATEARVPVMYPFRDLVALGGLMAYSVDLPEVFRNAASPMAEILRGTNPGDIPFYQPTKFGLVINTKAAQKIGFELPPTLLARADEVIE